MLTWFCGSLCVCMCVCVCACAQWLIEKLWLRAITGKEFIHSPVITNIDPIFQHLFYFLPNNYLHFPLLNPSVTQTGNGQGSCLNSVHVRCMLTGGGNPPFILAGSIHPRLGLYCSEFWYYLTKPNLANIQNIRNLSVANVVIL